MSHPHSLPRLIILWLLGALIAFGALWPLLDIVALSPEYLWALLLVLTFTLAAQLTGMLNTKIRPYVRLLLIALVLFLPPGNGMAQGFWQFLQAIQNGAPFAQAVLIHSDTIVPFMALALSFYGTLLSRGDPAFAAPLIVTLAMMSWFSGARQHLEHFIPAATAIPLMFAINRPWADVPQAYEEGTPRRFVKRALPAVIIMVLLATLLTPPYRTTYEPLEQKADELRNYINDYFFFTDTREAFALRGEGWQPQGDDGLGGTPRVPDTPVMDVTSEGRVYLRGTIHDLYNGRAWYDTLSNQRYGYNSVRFQAVRDSLMDTDLPREGRLPEQSVSIHMLRTSTSTLFTPQRVRSMTMGPQMVPYFNLSSELFITRNLEAGDRYGIVYEDYTAGPEVAALARGLESDGDPQYFAMQQQYTGLPGHLTPDGIVADLARQMASGAAEPYQAAANIMRALQENYMYTLEVEPAPADVDFTAHFLFETKAGYCTYFATAMTVLARSVDLPARYVEGFAAEGSLDGTPVTITSRNGHAWAEVYIPSVGWVVFDATAPSNNDDREDPDRNPNPTPEPSPSPPPDDEDAPSPPPEDENEPDADTPTPPPPSVTPSPDPSDIPPEPWDEPDNAKWLRWLLLLALILLFVWRAMSTSPARRARKAPDATQRLHIWWQAYCRAQRQLGLGMQESETMREYALRVAPEDKGLLKISEVIGATRYGRRLAGDDMARLAQLRYNDVYRHMNPLKKALAFFTRLLPQKKLKHQLFKARESTAQFCRDCVTEVKKATGIARRKKTRKRK